MKWEDFVYNQQFLDRYGNVLTNIECPDCGNQIYLKLEKALLSNPPKHKFKCLVCGWEKWEDEKL